MPGWMIDAGFRSYTQYSNDTLEAHMAPGRPVKERIFAYCCRNAWGRQCEFVLAAGSSPAWQTDICEALNLQKTHVSLAVGELVDSGWLRVEGKLIYPQAAPPIEPAAEESASPDDDELELPTFDAWLAESRPEIATRFQAAMEEWNEVRKLRRKALTDYEEEAERLRVQKVTGTTSETAAEKLPVQARGEGVPVTKSDGYQNRILIEKKANKKLASDDPAAVLLSKIKGLQANRCLTKLGPISNSTVTNFLQHGTPEEVAALLWETWREHKADHWKGWGLAVMHVRSEIEGWRERAEAIAPEPVQALSADEALRLDIATAIRMTSDLWKGSEQYEQYATELAMFEARHPKLVARIREEILAEDGL